MSVRGTTWFAVTAVPSSASMPAPGTVTTVTLNRASLPSASSKPNSADANTCGVPSCVVTVLLDPVGAVLAAVVPTVPLILTLIGTLALQEPVDPRAPHNPMSLRVQPAALDVS